PTPRHVASIQRYQVLPPEKVFREWPLSLPSGGYPYAVVGDAPFNAQEQKGWFVGGKDKFLNESGGTTANIVTRTAGLSLPSADRGDMAIEDSNLEYRQPKAFYATPDIMRSANQKLAAVQSQVVLVQSLNTITVVTGHGSKNRLRELRALYKTHPDQLPQNCNAVAAAVIGGSAAWIVQQGPAKAFKAAARLAPNALPGYQPTM